MTEKPVDHSAERPQGLQNASPLLQGAVVQSTTSPATPRREAIPAAHVARIRTWVKYGMPVPQVAAIYGAEVDEIVRIPGKA